VEKGSEGAVQSVEVMGEGGAQKLDGYGGWGCCAENTRWKV
jgi:hypothetical protein